MNVRNTMKENRRGEKQKQNSMLLKQGDRKKRFRRRKRKNKVERGNEIGEESKKKK